jgi:glutamine transport system permease protein
MQMHWEVLARYYPLLVRGALDTLQFTTISVALGTLLGLFVALLRLSRNKPLRMIVSCYVEFFRGTPLLTQIMLIHFGLPRLLGYHPNTFFDAILALTLNSGAYIAEIFRGGIQSIERGQMEASRSLGMSYAQAMRYVILPQAVRRIIPPMVNEFIAMLKDSSLLAIISVNELMFRSIQISGRTFRPFEVYLFAALLYLVMTMTFSYVGSRVERRMAIDDSR